MSIKAPLFVTSLRLRINSFVFATTYSRPTHVYITVLVQYMKNSVILTNMIGMLQCSSPYIDFFRERVVGGGDTLLENG